MKFTAILILIVVAFSLLLPGSWGVAHTGSAAPALHTLDVCHTSTPVVSQELPSITASLALLPAPQIAGVYQPLTRSAKPLLLVSQDERPPKSLI